MIDLQILVDTISSYNVINYGTQCKPLFKASDIGDIVGIKKVRKTIQNFGDELKVLTILPTRLGNQNCYALTPLGVYTLLSVSRKTKCIEILNKINHHKLEYKPFYLQSSFSSKIQTIFNGETIHEEYVIYRIDLYLPDYKLAIEFDEEYHSYQKQKDKDRQMYIISKLGCVFRHNYKEDILEFINTIYKHIRNYRTSGLVT
jgi:hypothetical protein